MTFVEWTRRIPDGERITFVNDALDNYARVASPDEPNVFRFYQMEVVLQPA